MPELTISREDIELHAERQERLWFAPASDDGDLYWAEDARGEDDVRLAYAGDLAQFARSSGERMLHFACLAVHDTDYWARKVWLDGSVDIVVVTGFARWPYAHMFGPLQHSVMRRQFITGGEELSYLPGGIWRLVSENGHSDIASAWCGAAGLMM